MNEQTEHEIDTAIAELGPTGEGYPDEGAVEVIDPDEKASERLPAVQGAPMDAGTFALAALTDEAFVARLAMLRAGRVRIAQIQRELLRPGVDYGVIPGTEKPTLLKPGAEKLCDFYRFAADFRPEVTYGDGAISPPVSAVVRCELHLGSLDGPVVAVGYGQANSWEKRYRYRRGGRTCPKCGVVGALTARPTSRGAHWCVPDKGGCGENVSPEDAEKAGSVEQVENPDPYELANTLVKMGEKRAFIDATLRATATSGLFTQDAEDFAPAPPDNNGAAHDDEPRGHAPRGAETATEADVDYEAAFHANVAEGLCPVHRKPFQLRRSASGSFWADGQKMPDGTWCRERPSQAWAARQEVA